MVVESFAIHKIERGRGWPIFKRSRMDLKLRSSSYSSFTREMWILFWRKRFLCLASIFVRMVYPRPPSSSAMTKEIHYNEMEMVLLFASQLSEKEYCSGCLSQAFGGLWQLAWKNINLQDINWRIFKELWCHQSLFLVCSRITMEKTAAQVMKL